MITGMGVDLQLNPPVTSMRELLGQGGFDAVFVGSGAPKGKELKLPGAQAGAANIHIGIAWLESVAFGHIEQDRAARAHHRCRQHGHGLLPHQPQARRRERQGHGAQAARLLQGLRVGAGRRRGGERRDRRQPLAQGLRDRERQADRDAVRPDGVRRRRRRPHHRRAHRGRGVPAGRRRDPRHRPGERLPVDRARPRHRIRQVGRAAHRQDDLPVDAAARVLRRRCGVRSEEHHLGGRARPPGRDLHPPPLPGPAGRRAAGPRHQSAEPQDGHARVVVRQRLHAGRAAADAARVAQGALQEAQHRGRARLHRRAGRAGSAALPQLRRADGVHARSCASNAMPASTSARWTASPSPTTDRRPSCAHASRRRRRTSRSRCTCRRRCRRPPASWSRTRTCACTAGCAPSAVRPPPGTCRSPSSTGRWRRTKPAPLRRAEPKIA